ncbi:MAG: DinB family protein [Acidimicrobiales bacterium]
MAQGFLKTLKDHHAPPAFGEALICGVLHWPLRPQVAIAWLGDWDGDAAMRKSGAMSEPTTPLPGAKAFAEDERSVLLGYLTYHRTVLARKAEGVSDGQARRAASPPSTLTLLGLIRHMTDVERWWFRLVQLAEDVPALFDDDEEWHPPDDATIAEALAAYWDEIAVIDRYLSTASMDETNNGEPGPGRHTLRRTIVHMIEEYARHCGHADLLREAIDGTTGD